jgi:hypothetical protein
MTKTYYCKDKLAALKVELNRRGYEEVEEAQDADFHFVNLVDVAFGDIASEVVNHMRGSQNLSIKVCDSHIIAFIRHTKYR